MFFILTAITLCYSYYTLTTHTILGTDYTAPFSVLSYRNYLTAMIPILLLSMFFFVSFLFSKKEASVQHLTLATKVNKKKYLGIKLLAITISFIITALITISMSFIFYAKFFNFYDFTRFLLPSFVFLGCTLLGGIAVGIGVGLFVKRITK